MTDPELLIRRDLDQVVALPPGLQPDWADVERRVQQAATTAEPRPGLYRRMRRRPLLALMVVLVIAAIPVSALAVSGQVPLSDWPFYRWISPAPGTGVVIVTRYSSDGQSWVLEAFRTSRHGRNSLCYGTTETHDGLPVGNVGGGTACGPVKSESVGFGLSQTASGYQSSSTAPGDVTEVELRFANGVIVRTRTIPAPAALGVPVRFYMTAVPTVTCAGSSYRRLPSRITQVVGLNQSGAIVTTRTISLPPPGGFVNYLCPSNTTFGPDPVNFPRSPIVAASRIPPLKLVMQFTAPYGARATLSISRVITVRRAVDARCWRITFSQRATQSGCYSLYPTGDSVTVLGVQPVGRDVFVVVQTWPSVARVAVRFADGDRISDRPLGGIAIFAIPASHLSSRAQKVTLTGYSTNEQKIASNAWAYYRSRRTDRLPEPQ